MRSSGGAVCVRMSSTEAVSGVGASPHNSSSRINAVHLGIFPSQRERDQPSQYAA